MATNKNFIPFDALLWAYSTKNKESISYGKEGTHTRMNGTVHEAHLYESEEHNPNKYKRPANCFIPNEKMSQFYDAYYREVFVNKMNEFMTEKQNIEIGGLMVDLDLHFPVSVKKRVYTEEDKTNLLLAMMEILSEIVELPPTCRLYVFEKPHANLTPDKTKDGLHVKIDLVLPFAGRVWFRKKLMEWLAENMQHWGLINSWSGVVDEGIVKGGTPWQVYGSRKPNNEAYVWTGTLEYTLVDEESGEPELAWEDEEPCLTRQNLESLMARTPATHRPVLKEAYRIPPPEDSRQGVIVRRTAVSRSSSGEADASAPAPPPGRARTWEELVNQEALDKSIEVCILQSGKFAHEWMEVKEYMMALPEKYFQPGSHLENRKIAFALKDKDALNGFLFWIKLRSRATDFSFSDVPKLLEEWQHGLRPNHSNPIRFASLAYLMRQDAPEEYKRIHESSLAHLIEKTFHSAERATDFDLAMITFKLYKGKLIITEDNIWHQLEEHRWAVDQNGDVLRKFLSTEVLELFEKVQKDLDKAWLARKKEAESEDTDTGEQENEGDSDMETGLEDVPQRRRKTAKKESKNSERERYEARRNRVLSTCNLLKNNTSKNKIMAEAAILFRDTEFNKKLNTNGWLMGFNNGVVDFEKREFRAGRPDDYITFQTGHDYVELSEIHQPLIDKINDFFQKICPVQNSRGEYAMKEYLLDFLAACLIGVKREELFFILYGSGSNGKGILDDLMKCALGDYHQSLPTSILTNEPVKPGGTSSEIYALIGKRFVMGSESSKGVVCNEGTIKWLTGGGELTARELHKTQVKFKPQFYLVYQTNSLFEQRSNDDGTWRRLKIFPMLAKFCKKGELFEDNTKYVFEKNEYWKLEFPKECGFVFINMLVQRAFHTQGKFIDCEEVVQATQKYRREQNLPGSYFQDRLRVSEDETQCLSLSQIKADFARWLADFFQGCKAPRLGPRDLEEFLSLRLGPMDAKKKWKKVSFVRFDELEEDVEDVEEP